MIFGAILAGGVGSRMNIESMPKQYLPLNEKPVFIHTLEKFLLCSEFDAVFIGTHGDWVEYTKDAVAQYGFGETPVHVVQGGADRNGTILEIIKAIEERYGESDEHVIVTHDSVRPFRESVDHQGEYRGRAKIRRMRHGYSCYRHHCRIA